MGESGGEGEGAGSPGPRPAAASSYLEQFRNRVTGEKKEWVEARCAGCRSRFCPHCCLPLGIKLKKRLRPELAKFTGLMMLTFTIDPELFASPREAFEYVKENRCISVTMQRLDRWGLLHSRRYVVVIEWQENGWPHWHVLVDASHIPFDRLCEAWNRNYPRWQERVALGRPGFGSVRFTASNLDRNRAAGYVTAYLTKHPEHGYPEWVREMKVGTVRRFEPSRGFWTETEGPEDDEQDASQGEGGCNDSETAESEPEAERCRRTIAEQVASCGQSCVVLRASDALDEHTGEIVTVREFVATLRVPLAEFLRTIPADATSPRGTVALFLDVPRLISTARTWAGYLAGET